MAATRGHAHNHHPSLSTQMFLKVLAWIAFGIGAFIVSMYLASGVVLLVRALGVEWSVELPLGMLVYRLVTYVILALLIGAGVIYRSRKSAGTVAGLTRPLSWKDIGMAAAGVIIYLLTAVVALKLFSLIPGFPVDQAQDVGFSQVYGFDRFMAFIVLVILTPLFEELVFRGFLYGRLRRYSLPWWIPAIIVSALFGLAHMQWNVAVDVFFLSMVACGLRELTGTIWPGILVHILKNLVAFMVLFVFTNGLAG